MKPSAITQSILKPLLRDKDFWEWDGNELISPKMRKIKYEYWRTWEYLFVEEIYFDILIRSYEVFKIVKSSMPEYKDPEYVETHFGSCLLDGVKTLTLNCDSCLYELQRRLSDDGYVYSIKGRMGGAYLTRWISRHPEWERQEIDEKMIDELGYKPAHNLVMF